MTSQSRRTSPVCIAAFVMVAVLAIAGADRAGAECAQFYDGLEDAASIEALVRLMESPDDITGPVNTGNPDEFTIRELAEQVVALTGSTSEIVERPLPSDDPTQRQPDITLARETLGWEPKVKLAEGLRPTVAYFRELLDRG